MDPSLLLALLQGGSALGQFGLSYQQSRAERMQGDFAREIANRNASYAQRQAEDALKRGGLAADESYLAGRRLQGAQRAAFAAGGTDPNSGSALDLQSETRQLTAADEATIRINAAREAWGYKSQALNDTFQGRVAQLSAYNKARGSMMYGAFGGLRDTANIAYLYGKQKPVASRSKIGTAPLPDSGVYGGPYGSSSQE